MHENSQNVVLHLSFANWTKIIAHVLKFMECLVEAYRMNFAPTEEKILMNIRLGVIQADM